MICHNDKGLEELLKQPTGPVRVVIDTDTYNEIDDQYALAYGLSRPERIQVEAIYAAPFSNDRVDCVASGVERSYEEIQRLLPLIHRQDLGDKVYKGSQGFLTDEHTPQDSPAARHLVALAKSLPEGERLYVAALAAITDIASALLMEPSIADKLIVVWLGGHAPGFKETGEFNLIQDVPAARVVFDSGVPLVQIPCWGVTSHLRTTEPELRICMKDGSRVGRYLYDITCQIAAEQEGKCWSRAIWDLAVMMWLAGPKGCMSQRQVTCPHISPEGGFTFSPDRHPMMLVDWVDRDSIFSAFFEMLAEIKEGLQ